MRWERAEAAALARERGDEDEKPGDSSGAMPSKDT